VVAGADHGDGGDEGEGEGEGEGGRRSGGGRRGAGGGEEGEGEEGWGGDVSRSGSALQCKLLGKASGWENGIMTFSHEITTGKSRAGIFIRSETWLPE
jgi:hypothetical protein